TCRPDAELAAERHGNRSHAGAWERGQGFLSVTYPVSDAGIRGYARAFPPPTRLQVPLGPAAHRLSPSALALPRAGIVWSGETPVVGSTPTAGRRLAPGPAALRERRLRQRALTRALPGRTGLAPCRSGIAGAPWGRRSGRPPGRQSGKVRPPRAQ